MCNNCIVEHGPIDACMLGTFAGLIRDRGEIKAEDLDADLLNRVDINEFWNRVGPVTIWLEEQFEAAIDDREN